MTARPDISEVALAFAREVGEVGVCEVWQPPERTNPIIRCVSNLPAPDGRRITCFLDPFDLNAVRAAIQFWCDQNESSVELAYYGYQPGEWVAEACTPISVEESRHADPCYSLMEACLLASRKMKAA